MTQTLPQTTENLTTCGNCERALPASEFYGNVALARVAWCKSCKRSHAAARKAARASAIRAVTFGVEIETVGQDRGVLARAIAAVVGGTAQAPAGYDSYQKWTVTQADGRVWNIMRDGSLPGGGAEVVSPICRFDDMAKVQEVVRAVRAAGARVDSSCGIHVHVGVDQLGAAGCARLVRLVAAHEQTIVAMLGILPSRLRYCQATEAAVAERIERRTPTTMDELATAWYGSANNTGRRGVHYDESRYHGLNLHSAFYRGTVEFRWFNGTLHAGKVRAYIMLALGLTAKAIAYKSSRVERTGATKADAVKLLDRLNVSGDDFANCRAHLTAAFAEVQS